ncbi:MAG: DNA-binding response regulator [Microbacterium sp.]|jgi:DNA-binding NarL/FixJ family response regulator|nr:DNA-binding response regulator [Microbacterium sp.]
MVDQPAIRVLIADDNRPFRKGVRLRLEQADGIVVVGEAATGQDAVEGALTEAADVILMDLEMPSMNGIDATRAVLDASAGRSRVIVLTSHGEGHLVVRALRNGASGYLLKTHDSAQLIDAIRAAHRGEALVSTRMTPSLLEQIRAGRPSAEDEERLWALSRAEARVVRLLSRGLTSNEQLAKELVLSVNTIRSHIQSALKKVGASDRTQLALWGLKLRVELDSRLIGRL